jgi:hypothetical protein
MIQLRLLKYRAWEGSRVARYKHKHNRDCQRSGEGRSEEYPKLGWGGAMKALVEETVSHLKARRKDDPKPSGLDHFLSLLDLVRKK